MEAKKKVKVKKIGLLKYRLLVFLCSKKTGRRTRRTQSASGGGKPGSRPGRLAARLSRSIMMDRAAGVAAAAPTRAEISNDFSTLVHSLEYNPPSRSRDRDNKSIR